MYSFTDWKTFCASSNKDYGKSGAWSGCDAHSKGAASDPLYTNASATTHDLSIPSNSPLASGGTNLGAPYTTDITGLVGTARIGAYEYTGSTPPPPPTTYNITNFTSLVSDWLKNISNSPADVNTDGMVNAKDLGIMMSKWK